LLTLTDSASTVVNSLVASRSDEPAAGLRIHTQVSMEGESGAKLAVTVTPEPGAHDQVIESSGARVFVEENAAILLDDKILDADVDAQGGVSFALLPQAA